MAESDEERWVCSGCVREDYLHEQIGAGGDEQTCSFCGDEAAAITVEELADRIEAAFETHFVRTSDQPDGFQSAMLADRELAYEWDRDGEEVLWAISGAAEVSEEIAQEVLDILSERFSDFEAATMGEECEFDPESYYEQKGPNDIEFQLEWLSFERSLRSETRYFNKQAEGLLDSIFNGISQYQTSGGRDVIRVAGAGTELAHFSRARVFHAENRLGPALERPDRELGPPPSVIALGGRMNARGVSLFYGATDPAAALAEVRPPVGSRVLVGRFDVIRPLRLLDIDALRSVYVRGSVFDSGFMGRLELAKFVQSLSGRMTMPVMPDDEPMEYLITQVIADYLASNKALNLDGILYPSVQQPGEHQNVVLFRAASRVVELDLPAGTETSVHFQNFDEDGASPDYCVSDTVPVRDEPPKARPTPFDWEHTFYDPFAEPDDDRQPALSILLESLEVHHVEALHLTTSAYGVTRHRSEQRTSKFSREAS